MTSVEQIMQWAIPAVGVLAALYGILVTARAKPSGAEPVYARGFFLWPAVLTGVLAVVTVAVVGLTGSISGDMLWYVLGSFILGCVLLGLLFVVSGQASRKLSGNGGSAGERVGYDLLSSSGLLLCAAGLLGFGILMLTEPAWETMLVEPLVALALGFWLASAFWSLPSALYRWLLSRDNGQGSASVASLCVQFRSTPGEMAFLVVSGLACALAMAVYRFTEDSTPGRLYPLGAFAAAVLFGGVVSPLLAPSSQRRRVISQWLGIGIFLVGTGLTAYLLSTRLLADIRPFYCFGIGLMTAALLMLTARYRPPFVRTGSPFGVEIAIGEALMLLASAVLAFRWMAGYGIALCAVGLLASFAVLLSVGALWAARRSSGDSESDLPFMAHAAARFAEVVMAGGAFLLLAALLRLFTERAVLGRAGIDITEPYPLIGLVVGASFPILLRALAQSNGNTRTAGTVERSTLVAFGRWAAFRSLGIWLLAGITPLVVAFFWRVEAAGAFLVGLAAAELFLILTLWLGEVRGAADEGIRLATRSTHVLAVGSGLVAVLFVPSLIELTGALTRAAKIRGLTAVFAVLFVWVLIVVWKRLGSQKSESTRANSP